VPGRRFAGIHGIVNPVVAGAREADEVDRLLLQAARGDRDAFAALYDATAPLVYGVALRVVRDPARAEEITQEAYLDVWRHAAKYIAASGSARSWIVTIAHRRAVDVVRSEEASRRRMEEIGHRVDIPHDMVAERAEIADESSRLHHALDALSAEQRRAVELAYFDGLTYREVADRVGAPVGTIKSRMHSALKQLADILGEVK
jgi:RNA polymerase sigma-70 factor (ECF subfamily)